MRVCGYSEAAYRVARLTLGCELVDATAKLGAGVALGQTPRVAQVLRNHVGIDLAAGLDTRGKAGRVVLGCREGQGRGDEEEGGEQHGVDVVLGINACARESARVREKRAYTVETIRSAQLRQYGEQG